MSNLSHPTVITVKGAGPNFFMMMWGNLIGAVVETSNFDPVQQVMNHVFHSPLMQVSTYATPSCQIWSYEVSFISACIQAMFCYYF